LDLAYAAQEGLEHFVEATVWTQGVFALSKTAMASLMDQLDESDFGLFILAPSDVTAIRETLKQTVRDNVIFELGLFIGRLAAERCFLIVPTGVEDLHLPTGLLGLTPATFDPDRQDGNMVAALGPACNRIRKAVVKLGPVSAPAPSEVPPQQAAMEELYDDPDDCMCLIQSWMGVRTARDNTNMIRFADVDRELKLAPGSAKLYIEEVARRWRYQAARKGKDTILFEKYEDADVPF
jgi:Predicted nucleotide-binding protein containing TIR-like domain